MNRALSLVALLTLALLPARAAAEGERPGWDPARTWVFAVGILEWQESSRWASFPKAGRKDAELVKLLGTRGVPAKQVVFLKDAQGTRARILASFKGLLEKTRPGDLLIVYYAGHGSRDDGGETYFIPHDARAKDLARSGWSVRSLFATIEGAFQGARALLLADCCYSGALSVRAPRKKISYACLTSSLASTQSTGNWTFTECLLDGLRGRPWIDANGDRAVDLSELAKHTRAEMAFAEGQLSSFATTGTFQPRTRLARAEPRAHRRVGERLEVRWRGTWYRARVLQVEEARLRVHYVGWDAKWDEWVKAERLRPYRPKRHRKGAKVEVEWRKRWYPARILKEEEGVHLIHYQGYGKVWDEWVSASRIRLPRAGK